MLPPNDPVKQVRKRIIQYKRGIFCRAVMWDAILQDLDGMNAWAVLALLCSEDQRALRAIYEEWPHSLRRPAGKASDLRQSVEEWLSNSDDTRSR